MASLRQIKRSLRSISGTKQIMRVMQLVSGSKFKRAQGQLLRGRQVLEFLDGLLQRVLTTVGSPERSRGSTAPVSAHPLMRVPGTGPVGTSPLERNAPGALGGVGADTG